MAKRRIAKPVQKATENVALQYHRLGIDLSLLDDHVKRICRRNLRANCKCCALCPFKRLIETVGEDT